jgi:hypothetical protein
VKSVSDSAIVNQVLDSSLETARFYIRGYRDGDEVEIVQLFNKAYADYGGYVRKTPEYWRWCCLQRPDVEKKGVFVATDQVTGEIRGYVVAGKSGALWELVCCPGENKEEIVTKLLDVATDYLERAGASSVNFTAPKTDLTIRKASKNRGFIESKPPKMFLSILNFQQIVSSIAKQNEDELKRRFAEILLIKIKDAPFWVSDTIYVQISRNEVKVEEKSLGSTIQLQTDYLTLCSLLFGTLSPFRALIRSRLEITPFLKTVNLLRMLSALQIKAQWSCQLSDYG